MEYLDIHYDTKTKSFKSVRGVAPGGDVGDLRSIKIITEPPMCTGEQFDQFVRFLKAIGGYKEEKDLFGVPYDWRLIMDPTYWSALSQATRDLIEKHTGGCTNTKASLIGFSLGGLVLTRFLREQTPEWRRHFVKRAIFIGVPLGGCPKAFISVCGTIDELPGYDTPCVRRFLQRCSGAFMCSPVPAAFPNLVIIKNVLDPSTGEIKSFGIDQLGEAYRHPRFRTESAFDIYSDYCSFINNQTSEGLASDVELHILYSSVKDTTIGLDYRESCHARKVRESDYYRQIQAEHHSRRRQVTKARKVASQIPDECCPDLEPEEDAVWRVGDGMVPHLSLAYWDSKTYPDGKPYAMSVKCFVGKQFEHAEMFNRIEIIQHVYDLLQVSCLDHHLEPLMSVGSNGV